MTEVLPPVYLELVDSEWPPATSRTPAGTSEVGAWSVERELVGNVLPGNVRARSGLSVGVARTSIGQAAGKPLAPWATGDRQVTSRGRANLYADDGLIQRPLGDWIVDPASGALTSPQVDVDLIEAQYVGRRSPNALPASFMTNPAGGPVAVDPVWMVYRLARQVGYHAVPPPVVSTLLALPMQGSAWPDTGTHSTDVLGPDSWDRSTGPVSPVGAMSFFTDFDGELFGGTAPIYLTANVLGTVRFDLGFGAQSPSIELRPGGVFAVRSTQAAPWVTETYVAGDSTDWPLRVQLEIERIGVPGAWTGFRARARSGPDATYSAYATSNVASTANGVGYRVYTTTSAASSVSGVQITTTAADSALWVAPTADLDPIRAGIHAPHLPGATDAWSGIQEVCASHLAAAWVGQDKILRCRDRSYVAGVGTPGEPLDVAASVEDIAWSIDPADQADRLEITYAPADFERQAAGGPTPWPIGPVIWETPDVIEIPAGATIEIAVDVPFYSDMSYVNTWVPAWDTDNLWDNSVWSALPNRDGTGAQPVDTALEVVGTVLSAGRVVLAVTNTTAGTLYTVDANGQPALFLTAPMVARQDVNATVIRGLSDAEAVNPVTIDLGRHVQRQEDAVAIADYIWVRINSPMWKASSVRVALDWSRDIGDIVRIEHAYSDLAAKALVTKVALDAQPGEVIQTLDLVLLPPTWDGFDMAWADLTWDDFDAYWSGRTWTAFDLDPLATGA